jgi:hypothetical protein
VLTIFRFQRSRADEQGPAERLHRTLLDESFRFEGRATTIEEMRAFSTPTWTAATSGGDEF